MLRCVAAPPAPAPAGDSTIRLWEVETCKKQSSRRLNHSGSKAVLMLSRSMSRSRSLMRGASSRSLLKGAGSFNAALLGAPPDPAAGSQGIFHINPYTE